MRVIHVITKGDVGGAQTHVVELTLAQRQQGADVLVVAGTDGPAADRLRRAGVGVAIVPELGRARSSPFSSGALRALTAVVADARPDIVHAHSSNAGFLGRIAGRRLGVATVYTAHGWPFQAGAPILQRCVSWTGELVGGRLGDAVICLTVAEARRARHARIVANDRLWVVPNGVADVAPELRRSGSEQTGRSGSEGPSIVMVARFAPPKLQSELIAVMATLIDLPWKLTFVGDGPRQSECVALSRHLLGERAVFLGRRDDVPAILAGSDIAILWSRYEGMPMSLLEAMRAGLCCVASDLPGVHALYGDPPAGLVAGTSEALSKTLSELVVSRSRIRALGDLARSRYESSYTPTAMAEQTRQVYEAVLARRASNASNSNRSHDERR